MDDWSERLWRSLDAIAQDTETWLQRMGDHLAEASNAFLDATDDWADELQRSLDPEVNRLVDEINRAVEPWEEAVDAQVMDASEQINQVIDPVMDALVVSLGQWVETISAPVHSTVEPMVQNQPTCVGCRHYYGQAHGGNLLVCAMHPYGPEGEKCPDYEAFWPTRFDLD